MLIVFTIILFLLAAALHEVGHLIAMRKAGIEVAEIGLGIPVSGWPRLTFLLRRANIRVCLHPLIIGAYVRPSERGCAVMADLFWRTKIYIYCAGIIANLLFSLSLALATIYIEGDLNWQAFLRITLTMLVLSMWPTFFGATMVPLVGLACFYSLAKGIWQEPFDSLGGPVAIIKFASQWSGTITASLWTGVIISLSIGAVNCLPFVPLDGGAIMKVWLERFKLTKVALIYERLSACLLILIFAWALICDMISLFR